MISIAYRQWLAYRFSAPSAAQAATLATSGHPLALLSRPEIVPRDPHAGYHGSRRALVSTSTA